MCEGKLILMHYAHSKVGCKWFISYKEIISVCRMGRAVFKVVEELKDYCNCISSQKLTKENNETQWE